MPHDKDTMELIYGDIDSYWANPDFPNHVEDIQEYVEDGLVLITVDHSLDFRVGSYSTYSIFRKELCRLVHEVEPDVIWDSDDGRFERDFEYLINFSDCEGIIGPSACKRLLQDFEKWEDKVLDAWKDTGPRLYGNYIDFKQALEIGSEGLIVFC